MSGAHGLELEWCTCIGKGWILHMHAHVRTDLTWRLGDVRKDLTWMLDDVRRDLTFAHVACEYGPHICMSM